MKDKLQEEAIQLNKEAKELQKIVAMIALYEKGDKWTEDQFGSPVTDEMKEQMFANAKSKFLKKFPSFKFPA